jgi:hypothetical protein
VNVLGGDIVKGSESERGNSAGQADDVVGHGEVGGGQAQQQDLSEDGHHRVHGGVPPEQVRER